MAANEIQRMAESNEWAGKVQEVVICGGGCHLLTSLASGVICGFAASLEEWVQEVKEWQNH